VVPNTRAEGKEKRLTKVWPTTGSLYLSMGPKQFQLIINEVPNEI
jgi:hypothetical protein